MISSAIMLLIWVCVLALVIYVVLWALAQAGVSIPPKALKIIWIIVALVALLWLVQLLASGAPLTPPVD